VLHIGLQILVHFSFKEADQPAPQPFLDQYNTGSKPAERPACFARVIY